MITPALAKEIYNPSKSAEYNHLITNDPGQTDALLVIVQDAYSSIVGKKIPEEFKISVLKKGIYDNLFNTHDGDASVGCWEPNLKTAYIRSDTLPFMTITGMHELGHGKSNKPIEHPLQELEASVFALFAGHYLSLKYDAFGSACLQEAKSRVPESASGKNLLQIAQTYFNLKSDRAHSPESDLYACMPSLTYLPTSTLFEKALNASRTLAARNFRIK